LKRWCAPCGRLFPHNWLMVPVDLIVFDLDGTLVDSRQDLVNAVNHARVRVNLDPLSFQQVVDAVGDGVQSLIGRILGQENIHLRELALAAFREYYGKHLLDNTVVRPGVPEMLEHFKQKGKAVLTNKSRDYTLEILKALGISAAFERIECGDNHEERKPHPAGISRILGHFKVRPERVVIVGDSPVDIETGRKVGTHTCVVRGGFARSEVLSRAKPDFFIDSIGELKEHFN